MKNLTGYIPVDANAPDLNKDQAAYNKYYNMYTAESDTDDDETLDLTYDTECWSWECKRYVPPPTPDAVDVGYTSDNIVTDSEDEEDDD